MLLLLGTSRDAKLTCELLERVRINCLACHSTEDLRYQLALGAGAVLIAEECLHLGGTQEMLQRVVDQQPSWSDLPILILARSGADSVAVADAVLFLGNVTLLERPLRVAALISIVQTALRARYRQYQIQEQLRSLESARDAEATAAQRKDEFLAMLSHELQRCLVRMLQERTDRGVGGHRGHRTVPEAVNDEKPRRIGGYGDLPCRPGARPVVDSCTVADSVV